MPKPTFDQQIEALAALRDPIRNRLYRYVSQATVAVSRDEAAAALGITRAMAAFHLDKLVELGLLRAQFRRLSGRSGRGAGRPSKLYRRSRRAFAVSLPERNQELLARWLSETMSEAGDSSAAEQAAREYGRSLGSRVRHRISKGATPQRLSACVEDVIEGVGFEPRRSGASHVWTRNCPFDPLSRQYPDVVCHAAMAMVRGVIDGVGAEEVSVDRVDRAGRCCVVLSGPFDAQRTAGEARPINATDMR